jgi:DNA-binding Xre family transcriptional regulator
MKVTPRLSEILAERNLRQKDLAEMASTTEATISRFSRQSRYEIETLIRVSRALDMKVEDLFNIEDDK